MLPTSSVLFDRTGSGGWHFKIIFSPMVISYRAVIQYHNQDTERDTAKRQNISITMRIPHLAIL